MTRLVFRHAEVVLTLRGCSRFRIADQNLLKALDGLLKLIEVEFGPPLPENDLTAEVLRWQKTDETMMFIAVGIEDNDGGGPFHTETADQGLILDEIDLEGDKTLLNGKTDICIGIGNSFQLLASYSKPVMKIGQDQFLFLPCPRLSRRQRHFPLRSWHDLFPPPCSTIAGC